MSGYQEVRMFELFPDPCGSDVRLSCVSSSKTPPPSKSYALNHYPLHSPLMPLYQTIPSLPLDIIDHIAKILIDSYHFRLIDELT
jgi:hypothetical protein